MNIRLIIFVAMLPFSVLTGFASEPIDAMPPKHLAEISTQQNSASSGDIIWGTPVDGLSVGISSVTTSVVSPLWPIVYTYLENRGTTAILGVIQSRSMFILELDGQTYAEINCGGKYSPFPPGDRYGPISVDSIWFHPTTKVRPDKIINETDQVPYLSEGPHTLQLFYNLNGHRIPSPVISFNVKLRPYPINEGVDEITRRLKDRDYQIADLAARLRLVETRSALAATLKHSDKWMRESAARALGIIGDASVIPDLKSALNDPYMGVRRYAIESLVKLGEPFQITWVEPVIKSKDPDFQNVIWTVRRYGGDMAAPTLIRCLDMDDPSVKSYYNHTLVWQIGKCGGPQLQYYHDFDGKETSDQVEHNRKVLAEMKSWLQTRNQ